MSIPFIDLKAQFERIREPVEQAIAATLESCAFVMGPAVGRLEQELSAFTGAAHTITCANGTDALFLPLMAWGIGPGDAVFCPSFSFVATAEILPWCGASPVFVDIRAEDYLIDPDKLEQAILAVKAEGALRPRAIIAVDLFGQLADYPRIAAIAARHGLKLIADNAQAFGATLDGRHPIAWADAVTTSFFPAKPLGCYGDGGAVQTNDAALAELLDSLRLHGKATPADIAAEGFGFDPRYLNPRIGINSRLDSLQAAVLLEKLKIFPDEIHARQRIADRYNEGLGAIVLATPGLGASARSVWAQYTIEVADRAGLGAHLKAAGIPTAVYYPAPIHTQTPYRLYPRGAGGLSVSEDKARRVISLPMHPYLEAASQDRIIAAIADFHA